MTIEKTIQGIRITDMINKQFITRHFIGYTKVQAIKKFNNEVKQK
jgi:hypothetical protein